VRQYEPVTLTLTEYIIQ